MHIREDDVRVARDAQRIASLSKGLRVGQHMRQLERMCFVSVVIMVPESGARYPLLAMLSHWITVCPRHEPCSAFIDKHELDPLWYWCETCSIIKAEEFFDISAACVGVTSIDLDAAMMREAAFMR